MHIYTRTRTFAHIRLDGHKYVLSGNYEHADAEGGSITRKTDKAAESESHL